MREVDLLQRLGVRREMVGINTNAHNDPFI